jgi:hypothetical protein
MYGLPALAGVALVAALASIVNSNTPAPTVAPRSMPPTARAEGPSTAASPFLPSTATAPAVIGALGTVEPASREVSVATRFPGVVTEVRVIDGSRDLGAGSICCLVRDAQRPGDRYLLSCHHVLTGSGAVPDFSVDPNALTTLPDGEVIATLAQWAPLRFNVGFGTDAALARVVEPQVTDITAWGRGIRRIGVLGELPRPLFLLARRMTRTGSR